MFNFPQIQMPQITGGYDAGEAAAVSNLQSNPTLANKLQSFNTAATPQVNIPGATPGGGNSGWSWLNQYGEDGKQTQQGVLSPAIAGIGAAANLYLGLKGLSLSEDQFDFQKKAYGEQRDSQYKDYENRMSANATRRADSLSDEALNTAAYNGDRDAAKQAYVRSEIERTKIGG